MRPDAVPAVEIDQLTRRYGDFIAANAVTLSVGRGEVFGFLGPNGAGKTTTIKMLCGLVRPTSGRGVVDGLDIATEGERIKTRIGYMSQLFSLYTELTVEENIEFAAGMREITGARLAERMAWVLAMADLTGHRHRPTGALPLGWKQRLALGCAVLHEPAVLFLDEPTSGVDPVARRQFWDVIRMLSDRGTTVFVSTHYMEEAEYCDRLAFMNRGKVVALGTPAALRARMTEPILRIDTDDAPRAVPVLAGCDGVIDVSLFGRGLRVVVSDLARAEEWLSARLASAGLGCRGIERIQPSLEDVFVASVNRAGGALVG
ncbi:MAG TPA: ABC transporter ATP-binding protein [Gemmatimonadales bacterium]|nr:ABC transporter ATP-binding protein [Gemmatimonadales bacterium]